MVIGISQPSYRDEIEAALKIDKQRIGEVFRARQEDEDKHPQAIADELGVTVGPIHAYLGSIRTLIEGRRIFDGPTYVAEKARMLRSFSRRHSGLLSEATRQALSDLAEEHDRFVNDEEVITRENEEIEQGLESDNSQDVPGIYVYTYPHYYRSPVRRSQEDYADDRTYLKIGLTDAEEGAAKRIQRQIGEVRTALPEPPLILRIYNQQGVDLAATEKKIQSLLEAADHNRINRRGSGVGIEWFLTHLKFLDSIAATLGLEVRYERNEDEG